MVWLDVERRPRSSLGTSPVGSPVKINGEHTPVKKTGRRGGTPVKTAPEHPCGVFCLLGKFNRDHRVLNNPIVLSEHVIHT